MKEVSPVNYIIHQRTFYRKIRKDDRLKSQDISLYNALFQIWNDLRFPKKFRVVRAEAMLLSKIGSKSTYVKSLKWLHKCGYIIYKPPSKVYAHCEISIVQFTGEEGLLKEPDDLLPDTGNDTHASGGNDTRMSTVKETHTSIESGTRASTGNDTGSGPKMDHNFINKPNNNYKTVSKQTHSQDNFFFKSQKPPQQDEVENWFAERGYHPVEGRKFYFHNLAFGWTINGQPIKDWRAAAAKWAENIRNIDNRTQKEKDDDYDTPF